MLDTTGSMTRPDRRREGRTSGRSRRRWRRRSPRRTSASAWSRSAIAATRTSRASSTCRRDLDSMYATLMDFRAEGGGDGPEDVNAALHDAVHSISWSQDPKAYQVVFLVGDAPPHMDYPDDVKYPDTVRAATAKGIVVNTILAGSDTTTEAEWRKIAHVEPGRVLPGRAVRQRGRGRDAVRRRDRRRCRSRSTRRACGSATPRRSASSRRKEAATGKLHAEGSAASRAKRAAFNASASGRDNAVRRERARRRGRERPRRAREAREGTPAAGAARARRGRTGEGRRSRPARSAPSSRASSPRSPTSAARYIEDNVATARHRGLARPEAVRRREGAGRRKGPALRSRHARPVVVALTHRPSPSPAPQGRVGEG